MEQGEILGMHHRARDRIALRSTGLRLLSDQNIPFPINPLAHVQQLSKCFVGIGGPHHRHLPMSCFVAPQ